MNTKNTILINKYSFSKFAVYIGAMMMHATTLMALSLSPVVISPAQAAISPDCAFSEAVCTLEQDGVCVEQQLLYTCSSSKACTAVADGLSIKSQNSSNAFAEATSAMAYAELLASETEPDPTTAELKMFGGKANTCETITDEALLFVGVLSAVLTYFSVGLWTVVAAVAGGTLTGILETWKCCEPDPSKVSPGNGLCKTEDADLAAARYGDNAAVHINKVVAGRNHEQTMCFCLGVGFEDGLLPTLELQRCEIFCVGIQFDVIRNQTWCYFDSLLGKLINTQGRDQLALLSLDSATGAIEQPISFNKYATIGGWGTPVTVNGNEIRPWAFDERCKTPEGVRLSIETGDPVCPRKGQDDKAWVAVCSVPGGCGTLPSDPLWGVIESVDWTISPIPVNDPKPYPINKYVVSTGSCTGDDCLFNIHAWDAAAGGGQLHQELEMNWPQYYADGGWGHFEWENGSYKIQALTYSGAGVSLLNPPSQPAVIRWDTRDATGAWTGTWTEEILQDPYVSVGTIAGTNPTINIIGGCQNGNCKYKQMIDVAVTAKPWGSRSCTQIEWCMGVEVLGVCLGWIHKHEIDCVYNEDCSGFTMEQMQAIDFDKLDLQEYIDHLVGSREIDGSEAVETAKAEGPAQAQALVDGTTDPTKIHIATPTGDQNYVLDPTSYYPYQDIYGSIVKFVTLTLRNKYNAMVDGELQESQVASVTVDWGDGHVQSIASIPYTVGNKYTHEYPIADAAYSLTLTFVTDKGTYVENAKIRTYKQTMRGTDDRSTGPGLQGYTYDDTNKSLPLP